MAERIAEHVDCTIEELETIDPKRIFEAQTELGSNVFAAIELPKTLLADTSYVPRLIVGDCIRDGHFLKDDPKAVEATPQGYVTGGFYTHVIFRAGDNELWDTYPNVLRHLCDEINPYTPSWGNNHMVELHYIINSYSIKKQCNHQNTGYMNAFY